MEDEEWRLEEREEREWGRGDVRRGWASFASGKRTAAP